MIAGASRRLKTRYICTAARARAGSVNLSLKAASVCGSQASRAVEAPTSTLGTNLPLRCSR